MLCVYFGKKFIDVKISAWLPGFLWTWNLVPPTPKFLRSDFCLYIFEGLFFLKKEKYDGLILLKLKTKRHVFKRQCF